MRSTRRARSTGCSARSNRVRFSPAELPGSSACRGQGDEAQFATARPPHGGAAVKPYVRPSMEELVRVEAKTARAERAHGSARVRWACNVGFAPAAAREFEDRDAALLTVPPQRERKSRVQYAGRQKRKNLCGTVTRRRTREGLLRDYLTGRDTPPDARAAYPA